MKDLPIKLALIVPVYNEEEVLEDSLTKLSNYLSKLISKNTITKESQIVLINDGSKDKSWEIIEKKSKDNSLIHGIYLSKNVGHQNAIIAGLYESSADAYITIDADLQDDIKQIELMIDEYAKGNHIVFGVRNDRSEDSFFKKWTANTYYKVMGLLGTPLIPQHADFRLMSFFAVEKLKTYPEKNIFLRGLILTLGLKSSKVYYKREKRLAGYSKYNFSKMFKLALNGIINFSTTPLKLIVIGSGLFLLTSFGIFIYILISYIKGYSVSGWASLIASIYLVGGSIMFSLAILAEYISRIYTETKQRPTYIVEKITKN